ncbi:MAG: P1 family peptidase [bacterium]|nr:P1 family peptidase [bacterium]
MDIKLLLIFSVFICLAVTSHTTAQERKRARDYGAHIGVLETGKWNSITDVKGLKVGHTTLIEGDNIRTGVTVIMPHEGNIFREKVPAAVFVGNGYGKAIGFTQIEELGNIESPVALTNTLNIPLVSNALIDYILSVSENSNVRSVNTVVGETNDGGLNDIQGRHVHREHVLSAIENTKSGIVPEGNVGAGTGTSCLGFKGGIGSSSRVIPEENGGYTVGVLVQTNFGGILSINGAPVGRELENFYMSRENQPEEADGSCMIIIATDAPLSPRNLKRLAKRSFLAFGKVGAFSSNGSGDYSIAFSTSEDVRITGEQQGPVRNTVEVKNNHMSPLFLAVVEATEEAIYNSLFKAEDMTGIGGRTRKALPIDKTIEIMKKYNSLYWDDKLPMIRSRKK